MHVPERRQARSRTCVRQYQGRWDVDNCLATSELLPDRTDVEVETEPEVTDVDEAEDVLDVLSATTIRRHSVGNRIERWIQELKRRTDAFYASFTGHDVETTNNWLKQFAWTWTVCRS